MNNSGVLNTNKEQRLLLTTISRIGFFLLFIVFAVLVVIALFVSLNAPKPWSTNELSSWKCAGDDAQFNQNCGGVNLLDKSKKITLQLGAYEIFNQESRLEYYFNKKSSKKDFACLLL
ncbi:hypothetical protein EDI_303460 [Entamoeba dispar SAW760]|uniref:Uncharacterized protein n=1 Tax=Entamoeba dispar (strain ATCC PRA-260 / SAW760) TaxID=370354 RepID=B0ERG7_ENTDS|nr:uncharacterized protein EDI_303460 [Entamoeba dispar SAW760]EDR22867.1 hypothetical protein EDI_303460 [Entamoeba dispar SAW760]|eukprot:EDR22867.1 hypothetical protein EDI_303460 [Entamoeba dispar SAW760]